MLASGRDESTAPVGLAAKAALGSTGRIVVVRALRGLGDMLCILPALRALRSAFPRASIALIGLPEAQWLQQRYGDYIDEWLAFPGFPGIPERTFSASELASLLAHTHARRFDLAIQMHGAGTVSNMFTTLLGARMTAGFYRHAQFCPAPATFFRYPERGSEIDRWLHLTTLLGCPSQGAEIRFPLTAADRSALEPHTSRYELRSRCYVVIHPGAHDQSRRWPAARFAEVADALAERDFRIVLTGTAAEQATVGEVSARMRHPACDLAGRTTLGSLAALLEGAALLVTNDTGVSHLAAALGTRSVILFLASDPERWAPLDRNRHRRVRPGVALARPHRVGQGPVPAAMPVLDHALALLEAGG
jgi:ADP-heptose:LPS heptosyltransferase